MHTHAHTKTHTSVRAHTHTHTHTRTHTHTNTLKHTHAHHSAPHCNTLEPTSCRLLICSLSLSVSFLSRSISRLSFSLSLLISFSLSLFHARVLFPSPPASSASLTPSLLLRPLNPSCPHPPGSRNSQKVSSLLNSLNEKTIELTFENIDQMVHCSGYFGDGFSPQRH